LPIELGAKSLILRVYDVLMNDRVGFEMKSPGRKTSVSMPSAVGLISNTIQCWWISPLNR
jgi:hypothetical protein